MPRASENASAIAIVNIPPMTASFEWVPERSPTINPRVVIMPEVNPKLNPTFSECVIFISLIYKIFLPCQQIFVPLRTFGFSYSNLKTFFAFEY